MSLGLSGEVTLAEVRRGRFRTHWGYFALFGGRNVFAFSRRLGPKVLCNFNLSTVVERNAQSKTYENRKCSRATLVERNALKLLNHAHKLE